MPLPAPAPRNHLHTRTIECRGYRREDGLWDVEGHLVDTKTYSFDSEVRGHREVGDPIHDMSIRLTVDDDLVIHDAVASTNVSPYAICGAAAPKLAMLKGLQIGPGWTGKAQRLFGGRQGCTHLFELLRPIATTCFQTMSGSRFREDKERGTRTGPPGEKPFFIDSCHALSSDGAIVKEFWPEFYTGDAPDGGPSGESGGPGDAPGNALGDGKAPGGGE